MGGMLSSAAPSIPRFSHLQEAEAAATLRPVLEVASIVVPASVGLLVGMRSGSAPPDLTFTSRKRSRLQAICLVGEDSFPASARLDYLSPTQSSQSEEQRSVVFGACSHSLCSVVYLTCLCCLADHSRLCAVLVAAAAAALRSVLARVCSPSSGRSCAMPSFASSPLWCGPLSCRHHGGALKRPLTRPETKSRPAHSVSPPPPPRFNSTLILIPAAIHLSPLVIHRANLRAFASFGPPLSALFLAVRFVAPQGPASASRASASRLFAGAGPSAAHQCRFSSLGSCA